MTTTRTSVSQLFRGLFLLVTAFGVFFPGSLSSQPAASDEIASAVAAVEIAYDRFMQNTVGVADGMTRLDAAKLKWPPPAAGSGVERHEAAFLNALATLLDISVSERWEVLRCPEGPGSCCLHGATVLIAIGGPQITGDEALVAVEITYASEVGGRRVLVNGWEVILERKHEQWRFVRFGTRWAS